MLYLTGIISTCIIIGIVLRVFIENIYERKYENRKELYILIYVIYILLNIAVAYQHMLAINVVYLFAGSAIISALFYKGKNILINTTVITVYFIMTDLIASVIFSLYLQHNDILGALSDNHGFYGYIQPNGTTIDGVIILCTYSVLIRFLKKYKSSQASFFLNIYMLFLLVFEVLVIGFYIMENGSEVMLLFLGIGFIILDGGVLYLFGICTKNAEAEKYIQLAEQQQAMTMKYNEYLQSNYIETQKLLHDIKKHIRVIGDMDDQHESIQGIYKNELLKSIVDTEQKFRCSNVVVNAIIWENMQLCKQENIKLDISMQDIEFDFMNNMDLTSLFANMFDNAVDACKKCDNNKRRIVLHIHKYNNYVVINLVNSIKQKPEIREGKLVSTKQNHIGLGMSILTDVVERYNGNIDYSYTDNEFETKIIISTIK